MVVKGLEIKPYLLRDAIYASQDYIICNFKLVDENLDKIMFDQQMNVNRVKLKMILKFEKIGEKSCITSMHVLMELPKLWRLVVSFITITN